MFVCVPRVVRPGLVGLVGLLAALTVVGCSASSNDDQPAPAGQPPSVQSPVADQPPNPAEKAQSDTEVAKDLALKENLDSRFRKYLDVGAKATDMDFYEGNALVRQHATEREVLMSARLNNVYKSKGQVLISAGEFTSHLGKTEKDHARLYACMNFTEATSLVKKTGETINPERKDNGAWAVDFKLLNNEWLVDALEVDSKEAAQKCGL